MQFQGKLNEAEVQEASRFIRPKSYRRRMLFTNIRLGIYAVIVLVVVFMSVVQHAHIPPQVIAVRVLILLILASLAVYRYRKGAREAVASLDASLPDEIELTAEGVRLDGPNGAHGFQPWTSYTGFREGEHVIALARREPHLFQVLPISALGPGDRETLRGMLGSYLPATNK